MAIRVWERGIGTWEVEEEGIVGEDGVDGGDGMVGGAAVQDGVVAAGGGGGMAMAAETRPSCSEVGWT